MGREVEGGFRMGNTCTAVVNSYNIMYETSRQSRFDAEYTMLRAGAPG